MQAATHRLPLLLQQHQAAAAAAAATAVALAMHDSMGQASHVTRSAWWRAVGGKDVKIQAHFGCGRERFRQCWLGLKLFHDRLRQRTSSG
jgi:hypothetical protein